MMPFLKEGDIVYFRKYKQSTSTLKAGHIVIFKHPINNQKQIKRIKKVNLNCIEVIGDNLDYSKDSRSFGLLQKEKIIGIVTSKIIKIK